MTALLKLTYRYRILLALIDIILSNCSIIFKLVINYCNQLKMDLVNLSASHNFHMRSRPGNWCMEYFLNASVKNVVYERIPLMGKYSIAPWRTKSYQATLCLPSLVSMALPPIFVGTIRILFLNDDLSQV